MKPAGREVMIPIVKDSACRLSDISAEPGGANIATVDLWSFPIDYYPLDDDINQVILHWMIITMPTGASYVDLTPVSTRALVASLDNQKGPFYVRPGSGTYTSEIYRFTWDATDATNNRVTPKNYTWRETAAHGTVVVTNGSGATYNYGRRLALPTADPYLAFLIQHDGSLNTGSMILQASLRWA